MTNPDSVPAAADQLLNAELPKDLDSEAATLGSILLLPDAFDEIAAILQPEDFFDPANRALFRHMQKTRDEDGRIDVTLLYRHVSTDEQFHEAGGAAYFARISAAVSTAAQAVQYAKHVREFLTLRQLIHLGTELIRDAYRRAADGLGQPDGAEQRMLGIPVYPATDCFELAYKSMSEVLVQLDRRLAGELPKPLGTGFQALDDVLCGLKPGQLIILAGRPSIGKTALALNIAEHVAMDQGIATLFISLAMSATEIAERLLTAAARVSNHRTLNGIISVKERDVIAGAAARFQNAPLHLDDSPHARVSDIAATVRRTGKLSGSGKLGLVVIDYLQLIQPDNARAGRYEQVVRIMRRLKQLAKETHCPVLCLCRLSRQAAGRPSRRPCLEDLGVSGAIEQAADVVLFVHRRKRYLARQRMQHIKDKAEIIVAKHRNGPTGIVKLTWLKEITRFEEAADA
jgi:replicative DNA helicase